MPFELLIVVCRACARERGFVKERGGPLLSLLSLLLLPLLASHLRQLAQVIRSDPAKKRTTRVLRQRTPWRPTTPIRCRRKPYIPQYP
jgi:hypothetical protein